MTNSCLNCSAQLAGKFCAECGQKAATHRFTMHEWLHEIPHSILHVDSGFFHTFKSLCLRPGDMIREYLNGKRKEYFSPFLYVLILCGLYVVVSHLFADPTHEKIEITDFKSASGYLDANYYKATVVAMIFPMALASLLTFWKTGYNFAEHLVLNTFIISQMIIGDIIIYLVIHFHLSEKFPFIIGVLQLLLKFPFWFWAYWQFFKPKNLIVGALQVLFAVILGSLFAGLMIGGFAYLLFLLKAGANH